MKKPRLLPIQDCSLSQIAPRRGDYVPEIDLLALDLGIQPCLKALVSHGFLWSDVVENLQGRDEPLFKPGGLHRLSVDVANLLFQLVHLLLPRLVVQPPCSPDTAACAKGVGNQESGGHWKEDDGVAGVSS